MLPGSPCCFPCLPAPLTVSRLLRLLRLAQVMLLKNLEQGGARQLVNGSRGVIVRFITREEYAAQVGGWEGGRGDNRAATEVA